MAFFFNAAGFILFIFIQFAFYTDSVNEPCSLQVFEIRVLKICRCREHKDFDNNNNDHKNQRPVPPFGPLRAVFLFIYLLLQKEETNQSNLSLLFQNAFPCPLRFFCSSNNFGRFCSESSEVNSGGQAP